MTWNIATALDALGSQDLLDLGMSANQLRLHLHPEPVVTYELCGRASSLEEAAREAVSHTAAMDLERVRDIDHNSLDALKATLAARRDRFPEITFQRLPVSALRSFAENPLAVAGALRDLRAAGVLSLSANFVPALRHPQNDDLGTLLRAAADSGLSVAASVTIGNSETFEQRIDTLKMLRDLQQDSHAIHVALIRVHHAASAEARREEDATAVDYLKTLAVTRLFLDNVEHIQTDWSVMGPKVLELALRFGADDAGAIPWSQSGNPEPSHHGGESELRRIIRDAGFRPVQRDALFRQSVLH
jgi:cyclic dehypoxanthinyl futalosine synthase